jgi:hypothetical protein
MQSFDNLYWHYRQCGFSTARSVLMALPLWVSMIAVPLLVGGATVLLLSMLGRQ